MPPNHRGTRSRHHRDVNLQIRYPASFHRQQMASRAQQRNSNNLQSAILRDCEALPLQVIPVVIPVEEDNLPSELVDVDLTVPFSHLQDVVIRLNEEIRFNMAAREAENQALNILIGHDGDIANGAAPRRTASQRRAIGIATHNMIVWDKNVQDLQTQRARVLAEIQKRIW